MDTMEAILTRRSIRRYASKKVPSELITELLRAAMSAPSARNPFSHSRLRGSHPTQRRFCRSGWIGGHTKSSSGSPCQRPWSRLVRDLSVGGKNRGHEEADESPRSHRSARTDRFRLRCRKNPQRGPISASKSPRKQVVRTKLHALKGVASW
jgi:nitroreductase